MEVFRHTLCKQPRTLVPVVAAVFYAIYLPYSLFDQPV
jgi:hypothetical protein